MLKHFFLALALFGIFLVPFKAIPENGAVSTFINEAAAEQSGLVPCGNLSIGANGVTGSACTWKDVIKLAANLINFVIIVISVMAAVAFMYAGFIYLTSAGSQGAVERAKEIFLKVLLGYVIVLVAWVFVHALEQAFFKPESEKGPKSFLSMSSAPASQSEPPSSIGQIGLTANASNAQNIPQVSLKISQPGTVGLLTYTVRRNGQFLANTTSSEFIDTAVSEGQSYLYSVTAQNTSGLLVAQSGMVSVTTPGTIRGEHPTVPPISVSDPVVGSDQSRPKPPGYVEAGGLCEITITADVPAMVPNYWEPFTVSGIVSSNSNCKGDITITGYPNASDSIVKIAGGTTAQVSFTGTEDYDPFSYHLGGPVGIWGDYKFTVGSISASEGQCGANNSATVYSCSLQNDKSDTVTKQRCPMPNPTPPYDPSPLFPNSATSDGSATFQGDTGRSPSISDIVSNSLKLSFPKQYVLDTKTYRKFTPTLPFSPYDNLAISFEMNTCIVSADHFPLIAYLRTTDSSGKVRDMQIGEIEFYRVDADSVPGVTAYRGETMNNPQALVGPGDIEFLIDSIYKGRAVTVILKESEESGSRVASIPIEMTNCDHAYGEGPLRAISVRDDSAGYSPEDILARTIDILTGGYQQIDPFKKYLNRFSFFTDLTNYDDSEPAFSRACGNISSINYYFTKTNSLSGIAESPSFFSGLVRIHPDAESRIKSVGIDFSLAVIAMHETAHALAGVMDEYVLDDSQVEEIPIINNASATNCVINPLDPTSGYWFNGTLYGDNDDKGCSTVLLNRPTANSIMRHEIGLDGGNKFNTVSCGYILAAVSGTGVKSGPTYFYECDQMDTLKKR